MEKLQVGDTVVVRLTLVEYDALLALDDACRKLRGVGARPPGMGWDIDPAPWLDMVRQFVETAEAVERMDEQLVAMKRALRGEE